MDEMSKYLRAYFDKKKEEIKGSCPSYDRLVDYCHHRLDEKTEEELQDHVTLCQACRDQVLALKHIDHPFAWEEFEKKLHDTQIYEPKSIILYINGEPCGETRISEKGFGKISLKTIQKIDFIEVKNDKDHIIAFIDPALYAKKKIEEHVNVTDDRELSTSVEFKKDRAYINVIYKDKSKNKQLTYVEKLPEALKRIVLARVTLLASLAIVLLLTSYVIYKERMLTKQVNNLLQEVIPPHEKRITELKQQNEQLIKSGESYKAEIAGLKQEFTRPRINAAIYESIPLVLRSAEEQGKPFAKIEFTEKTKAVTLVFSFFVRNYKSYQVRIFDKDGKNLLWESGEQPIVIAKKGEPHAIFSLTLNEGFLPQGIYPLRIYGKSQKKNLIAEYLLQIKDRGQRSGIGLDP